MAKKLVEPRLPGGFGEYLPHEQMEFNRLKDIVRLTYEKFGYSPVDTPAVELTEVLLAKDGGETTKQVYHVLSRGGRDKEQSGIAAGKVKLEQPEFTLRYDLTVGTARFVAQHQNELTFPFRRYAIGKVHRAERRQRGRFNEFWQCDIDVIGSKSPIIDAEFPVIINEIFEKFDVGEFTVRLNDRRILNGFFESIGLGAVSGDILRIIDKMEKITEGELIAELKDAGLTDGQVDDVLKFTAITGSNDEILAHLSELESSSAQLIDGIAKLTTLIQTLRVMSVPESRFQIDLQIARGLDYYTGTVYETILDDHPEIGSVCSGGRYDDLAGTYTTRSLPGVGISIGLSRLFYKLLEVGIIKPTAQASARVVVMPVEEGQIPTGVAAAALLRQADVPTMLYTEPNGVRDKLAYANKMGIEYVVLVGPKEAESGMVTVKHMLTSDSSTIPLADLTGFIGS